MNKTEKLHIEVKVGVWLGFLSITYKLCMTAELNSVGFKLSVNSLENKIKSIQ